MTKQQTNYIGIDPGVNGGIVIIYKNEIALHKMPNTPHGILDLFFNISKNSIAVIEKVNARPANGTKAIWTFSGNYHYLVMALIASKIPFQEHSPQKWIKYMGIKNKAKTETKTQWKNRLKSEALKLYPNEKLTLNTCDALLIAEYCKRINE